MALSFPRDPVIELYLNGWIDVTTSVRQTSPITVTRGRSDEQGDVGSSKCIFVLDNTSGNFNPDNPTGAYYGLLGRNTPVRYSLRVAKDTFTRTVSSEWNQADTGDDYTLDGSGGTVAASDWNVASGRGTHSVPVANGARRSHLMDNTYRNIEVRCTFTANISNVTGGPIVFALELRRNVGAETYRAQCRINADESVNVEIFETPAGSPFVSNLVSGLTYSGQDLTMCAQIEGETLRAKVWATSTSEPSAWGVEVNDSRLTAAGGVGIVSVTDPANTNTKPVIFSYDNFEVRSVRFVGEVASLRPQSDITHTNKWVSMEASGILRRLSQGKSPIKSAIERYVVQNTTLPVAYWPLDDGELALSGRLASGVSGTPATAFFLSGILNFPRRAFGNGRLGTWLGSAVSLDHYAGMRCGLIPTVSAGTSWTMHCMIAFNGLYTDPLNFDLLTIGTADAPGFWSVSFFSTNGQITVSQPGTGTLLATIPAVIYDDTSHHIGFRATQNGANVDWILFVDGQTAGSGTVASITNPPIVRVALQQSTFGSGDDARDRSVGHVIFYSGDGPLIANVYDAMRGHPGESAGRRLSRLCDEEDIAFAYVGNLDTTALMGPQAVSPISALLQECALADAGTLFESRSTIGLSFRSAASLYDQLSALQLDYSAQQLAPPFEPNHDDQTTRNAVTVTRQSGSKATAILLSGPLNANNPGVDPDAVGKYDVGVSVNVASDSQLPSYANWLLHLGTVDEARFPRVGLNLRTSGMPDLNALDVNIDDRITIDNLSVINVYDQVTQLARGYTEVLDTVYKHFITFNTAPESPYHILTWDDANARWDSDGSTLASGITSGAASLSVAVVGSLWTTTGAQFPFNIKIGGEVMTLSGISGAASPQTFTVSARSVNGVVKAHVAGAAVHLANPFFWGL